MPAHTVDCPRCEWSKEVRCLTQELAAQVDAGMHWEDEHGGLVPDGADFGQNQCPVCEAMAGLDGTVSCSECGHIPEKVRA